MTEQLHLHDNYLKECESKVVSVDGNAIVLDKTVLYAASGGQPCDHGTLVRADGVKFSVIDVKKSRGSSDVVHTIADTEETLAVGDKVKCVLDWNRRHILMRHHTASHVLCGVIYKETGAKITGNQLGVERSRVDFNLPGFDREVLKDWEKKSNDLIQKDIPCRTYFLPYDEAMKNPEIFRLKNVLPPTLKEIRIIEVEGFDLQACGGTHLQRLGEIGKIKLLKTDNKGANNRRLYFTLE